MVKLFAMFAVLSGFAFASAEPTDQASCEAAGKEWKDNACVEKQAS